MIIKILIDKFKEQGKRVVVKDVIKDVLMKDLAANKTISESTILDDQDIVNVFRFKQSLDDPTLLFWRPW